MKKKKVLTVLLSVVMAASILCGCGERQETMGSAEGTRQEGNKESEKNKEPKTVTLQTKWRTADGGLYEYEYDAAGNMTKQIRYNYQGEKEGEHEYEYEYDAAGNITKQIVYDSSGKKSGWHKYEYDATGNMTIEEYDSSGDKEIVYLYKLDAADYMYVGLYRSEYSPQMMEYSPSGEKMVYSEYEREYEYDAAGNISKRIECSSSGEKEGWYEFEYDAADNMSKIIEYSSSGEKEGWSEYEYDAAGNMSKHTYYIHGGSRKIWNEFEYDADGNMSKWITYDGSIYNYEIREYITITLE